MKAISAAILPVRWNAPRWWPSLLPNSQKSNALSSKQWWSSMSPPVLPPSLHLATGQGCAEVEIAALRLDQCTINQRAGSITLVDAKGGKTRTLDLHNMARRDLYDYLSPAEPHYDDRYPESMYVFNIQRSVWFRQHVRPYYHSVRVNDNVV